VSAVPWRRALIQRFTVGGSSNRCQERHEGTMDQDIPDQPLSDHNRTFLARLGQSTQRAVIMTAHDGVIRSWNRGAEAIYRLSAADAIGQRLADIAPDDLLTMRLHAVTITVMSGEPWSGELQFVRSDGRPIWVRATASPMHSRSGQVIGTIWLAWDITERKQRALLDGAGEPAELRCVEHATY
jgi:PAS domain S-box-containing protein